MSKIIERKDGIVSLIIALILGAVIVEIGLNVAFLSFVLSSSNYSNKTSAEVLDAARSGIDDGILQIIRGKDSLSYQLQVNNSQVNVTICKGGTFGCIIDTDKDQITSVSSKSLKNRKLIAIIEVDPSTRLTKVESIREVAY